MAHLQISEKQKFWAFVIVSVLVVLWLGKAAVFDLSARARKNAQEVKLAEVQLKRALRIQQDSGRIAGDYAEYAPYLAVDNTSPRQVVEELLREIERIARDASVSIINLTPQSIPNADSGVKVYRADLRMECQGSDRLLSFLNGVQASKSLIKIDKFIVNTKDEQGVVLKAEMSLSLATEPG